MVLQRVVVRVELLSCHQSIVICVGTIHLSVDEGDDVVPIDLGRDAPCAACALAHQVETQQHLTHGLKGDGVAPGRGVLVEELSDPEGLVLGFLEHRVGIVAVELRRVACPRLVKPGH